MQTPQRDRITLPTSDGDAQASRLSGAQWRLTTPWNEELYTGDTTGAFRRLRELVWAAEATPEHNTAHQAVQESIRYLTALDLPLLTRALGSLEESHETTTLIIEPAFQPV
jgi:hypothetical protein